MSVNRLDRRDLRRLEDYLLGLLNDERRVEQIKEQRTTKVDAAKEASEILGVLVKVSNIDGALRAIEKEWPYKGGGGGARVSAEVKADLESLRREHEQLKQDVRQAVSDIRLIAGKMCLGKELMPLRIVNLGARANAHDLNNTVSKASRRGA